MSGISGAANLLQKIKEVFKHSIIYGLTSSLQSVLGFILLPILTTYYTTATFGAYSLLLLMSALASAIFYFGASSALARFYYDEDSLLYRKKIITTALLVTFGGAILLLFLALIFARYISLSLFQTDQYALAIILTLAGTAAVFLVNLMTLILRYEKKSFMFFLVTILSVLLNFGITYLLLTRFKSGIYAPLIGLLVSSTLAFLVLLFNQFKFITFTLEKKYFTSILSFGIQASVAGLFFYILEWVDRVIIKDLLDLSQVGVYSLGYRLGAILNILVIMPFSLIWAPTRMQYANNPDAETFTTKIISYYTIVGVGVVMISMLFGMELMGIFFKNKDYSDAAKVFPIIMYSLLFYGYQGILDFGIYFYKKIYYYIIISVFAIVFNVALNYWLIPHFGYMGAAFVTLLTYMFTSSSIYIISNKLFYMRVEWARVISPLIFLPLIYLVIHFVGLDTIVYKILLLCLSLILFFVFWLNGSERLYLNKIFKFMNRKNID
ncbi:hypothetical protein DHW03_11515 [Pedobacter yonginense]|uniref:Uncharacterized protein n=1 Tax=Pedobacter yonginense TaxID=651869 RepID=A0A317EMS6_9SPHI|nr:oligosaccharide flippase family protein [Pedobacter yonginense]PWS28170.1 hypothetical protein DHW03_11515 [Pedobacter yonginense]